MQLQCTLYITHESISCSLCTKLSYYRLLSHRCCKAIYLSSPSCLLWYIQSLLSFSWCSSSVQLSNCLLALAMDELRHHWLMPISCHFRDCKALLVASLTHVSGAITSIQTFTFTFTCSFHTEFQFCAILTQTLHTPCHQNEVKAINFPQAERVVLFSLSRR